MKNYSLKFEGKFLRMIREVGREAGRRGVAAYIVGGIVRDLLLKRENWDLDIVIEGDAILLAEALAGQWQARLITHRQFGTASLFRPDGLRVDFASARKERYAHPGALPIVRSGRIREDLYRRDFTVNAMAVAVHPSLFGTLVDEFGGLEDLSRRVIRVLHDASFIDDPTRILRAVRFEQRFGFRMDRHTLGLLKNALKDNAPVTVKPQRYFCEFKKILSEDDPVKCLTRLDRLGGLDFIGLTLPVRFQALRHVVQNYRRVQKQAPLWTQGIQPWIVFWMGIFDQADEQVIRSVLARFNFSREERTAFAQVCELERIRGVLARATLRPSEVYEILHPLARETVLYIRSDTSRAVVVRRIDQFLRHDRHVQLKIGGDDLKKIQGVGGPQIRAVLKDVLYSKIDRRLRTKKDEWDAAVLALKSIKER